MTYPLSPPVVSAEAVFLHCISEKIREDTQRLLRPYASNVAASEASFDASMKSGTAHSLQSRNFRVGSGVEGDPLNVVDNELKKVYIDRFAREGAAGREFYNNVLKQASKCPSCGHLPVEQVDHFMPKDTFQLLAICPLNLIPICGSCNRRKHNNVWTSPESVPLHPYYDQVSDVRWLKATVEDFYPATVTFSVEPPPSWPAELSARTSNHFDFFNLNQLYSAQAASALTELEHELTEILDEFGATEVVITLQRRMRSCEAVALNSWTSAMYRALSQSDWYCRGGFALKA